MSAPDDIAASLGRRPLPLPDNVSAPYWEAAARGHVLYQECPACGQRQFYPRALCTACAAEPEWRTASGRGTVHTFTVVRQNWAEPFRELAPYVVAIVELEEGPRMMSNVTGCAPEDVHIGMPVEAYTIAMDDGLGVPFWRPADTGLPVDFDDSPAEAEFRAQVRAWLDANAPRRRGPGDFASDTAHDDDFVKACKAWQGRLHDAGWAGITWPTEYGGRGLGPAFDQIFHDEQAAYGVSSAMFAVGIGMAGPTIVEHGTGQQKARFLPALLRGDEVWCQLFSEPGAGSDLAGISTRAERDPDGGGWVINGQKVWTSYARHSDFGILLARTHPDRPKHRGITYFLLDMSTPGIDVRPIPQMNGSAEFNEVFLTDVRVPDDRVLGAAGEGWRVAMSTLASERGLVGTDWPGFAELLDAARARGLAGDAATRQRLAEVYTSEQLLRFLGYRAKTALGRGEPLGPLASSINLFFAGHLKRTGDIVLSVLGADGLVRGTGGAGTGDADWTFLFLTWPCVRIASGTDEIQRNILGERALGLPPEPRVDKDVPFRDLVFSATTRASVGGSTRSPSSTRRRPEPDLEVEGDR